jgi:hypothetical protein
VFTARYALSPYIKQIRFVFKGLITHCRINFYAEFRRLVSSIELESPLLHFFKKSLHRIQYSRIIFHLRHRFMMATSHCFILFYAYLSSSLSSFLPGVSLFYYTHDLSLILTFRYHIIRNFLSYWFFPHSFQSYHNESRTIHITSSVCLRV